MSVISTQPKVSNVSVKERGIDEMSESFSSPLINLVEPNEIDGIEWTKFFTQVDTNLKVGDKVFIVNGNYDSYNLILDYEYSKGSTGYNILEINKTSITLDIEWTGDLPWTQDPFDDYIKVYGCNNTQETQYEVIQSKYYPYKYLYGYRGNNNILFCSTVNEFRVADPSNYSLFNDWVDVTSELMSNDFSLLTLSGNNITPNNGKLLIMNSFTYNGQTYEKGYVYKFENNEWVKDNKQRQSFLSKANFRMGSFYGNFNDGIFGNLQESIGWNSGEWNSGIFFNSIWTSGEMRSKSDTINKENHYASIEDGRVKRITDFNNNDGFGYNFSFDSKFESGSIRNVNATNCNVGEYTNPQNLIDRYLTDPNTNFNFDVSLNGRWVNSNIENSLIQSGLYEFSNIESSISTNGRFSDTDIKYSITSGNMEGMGKISILEHERLFTSSSYIGEDPDNPPVPSGNLIINHKFYISERDYLRIKSGSYITLNQLVTSNTDILNFFDNSFYLGVDKNGGTYLSDNYGNKSEVTIHLNSKKQNENKRVLTNSEFPLQETTNPIELPSIDLFIELDSITNLNSDLEEFLDGSSFDKNYRQTIQSINNTTLQIGRFEKSIFNGGNWEASKVNNPDYQIKRIGGSASTDYLDCSFSGSDLTVTLDDFTRILPSDQLQEGDIVYLSGITYDLNGTLLPVDGTYILQSYTDTPDLQLVLEDFGSQSIAGSYSSGGNFISSFIVDGGSYSLSDVQESFISIHTEKIQNTNIESGLIKRELLINDTFSNNDFIQQTNLDIRNVNLLKISEVSLSSTNNITAESGLFIRCFIKDNDWNNGIIYRSVLKDMTILDGILKQTRWIRGTFNDGIFLESRRETISDINDLSKVFTNLSIRDEWIDGEFNGGEFFDSIWTTGEFNGGKFYNSIFAAGNFNNGVFGDASYPNSSNKFGDAIETDRSVNNLGNTIPTWYNGTFNKGEFGIRNRTGHPITSILDNIQWLDGMFNDGTIVSYSPTSSVIWNDGTFDNGDIIGYVQWKDGTFNSGKFRSAWGTGYGTQSTNYAWEDGIFNGGRFGEPEGEITISLDQEITYRNPSWFNGRFNDGQFMGKIWNDGTFTGGRFMGNEDSTYFSNKNRETFPEKFEVNGNQLVNIFNGDLGQWKIGDVVFGDLGGFEHVDIEQSPTFTGASNPYSIKFSPISAPGFDNLTFNSIFNGDPYGLISPVIDYEVEKIMLSFNSFLEVDDIINPVEMIVSINIEASDRQGNTSSFFQEDIPQTAGNFNTINNFVSFIELTPQTPTLPDMEYKIIVEFEFDDSGWAEAYFKVDDIDFIGTEKEKISSIPDQFVMDYSDESLVNFYGMWRNGEVISDNTVTVGESNFVKLSKLESVKRFKGESNPKIFFENALWIDGEFKAFGQMDNCVWLSGEFRNGRFLNSAFNPYVPRWDFYLDIDSNTINETYSFDLDDESCVWKSGYLDNSQFSISIWENGTFNSGDMFGGLFRNGIANYINTENCIWENGIWRNGNWYGANFNKNILFKPSDQGIGALQENIFIFIQSKITDSIVKNSIRLNSNDIFAWSVIDTSDDTIYSSNLSYRYADLNGNPSSVLTFDNNDFLTVGSFSQINILDGNYEGVTFNRSLELNFINKGYSGYKLGSGYQILDHGLLDFSDVEAYPTDVETTDGFITSMWGNGVFIKGRWQNGTWNNGPRLNQTFGTENTITFLDNVNNFFENGIDRWQIDLSSDETIPTNFKVGDHISLGNIVALTVNDDRKFLNDSYQIIRINRNTNSLSVIVKVTFPIKSIEKDSNKHRIMMTNNVWESGTFHNGRFEGVWNYGRFEGYPNITTMENTHWIDGILDGGKISSNPDYEDSLGRSWHDSLIQNARINIRNEEDPNLSETVLDLIYNGYDPNDGNPVYSHLWVSGFPSTIETTDDILSSNTKVILNNREIDLSLGVKFKRFGDLIQDDLEGITSPETLESRGWTFSVLDGANFTPLPSNQEKFLGYESSDPSTPSDNMVIDTYQSPTDSPYGTNGVYLIGHDNLENVIKGRYWEVSFKIIKKDFGTNTSGSNSKITPISDNPTGYYNFEEGEEIKSYYWNFRKNSPFITLDSGVVAKIDNIKFEEVDYIPFPDIRNNPQTPQIHIQIDPDNTLKVPKTSISLIGLFSESDSIFIDNKLNL